MDRKRGIPCFVQSSGNSVRWIVDIDQNGNSGNVAPVATNDSATTTAGTPVVINVLANDTDANGNALIVVDLTQPASGSVALNANQTVTYTPAAGFTGAATFTYRASDGAADSNVATVMVNVTSAVTIKTYPSTNVPLAIPDNGTSNSTLTVPSTDIGAIRNVTVNITHTRDADMDVFLISPLETRVELFTEVGGNGDHFTNTILDGDVGTSITSGTAPFTGTFRPEGNLNLFDGQMLAGQWRLEVTDDQNQQTGTLVSWSITIEYQPPAATIAAPVEPNPLRQNPRNALDVNNDATVSPIDALLGINALSAESSASTLNNALRSYASGAYLDVSGDGELSPLDSLLAINWLNRQGKNEVENQETFDPNVDRSHRGAAALQPPHRQAAATRLAVNRDEFITPIDALLAINALSAHPSGRPSTNAEPRDTALQSADVSGDGVLSPHDPLLVINWLNRRNRSPQSLDPDDVSANLDDLESTLGLLAEDVASSKTRANA
jgi:subtilisin-like proprotein convertase family protein